MLEINADNTYQTIITTFEVTPGSCEDVLDLLYAAYAEFISMQPGFIAAALHVNDAQTRIANYSQWERRENYLAMLRTPEMRERNRVIHQMCKNFAPVMYDVRTVF